jgi:hypothetical protein
MIQASMSAWLGRAYATLENHGANVARIAFVATVVFAGATFWFVPRPPMGDLPQHAGQVVLLHDLWLGQSKWQSLVYINYFTPYLVGTVLAAPLLFVMSALSAVKLVLTLAFFAFVAGCVALRRRLDGDPRLDWLFIPGFFGYAYAFGFYPFLVATPLGVLFILLAHRYASRPTPALGVVLFVADLILFFSHGLVLLFASAIGGLFLLIKCRPLVRLMFAMLPYVAVGLCVVTYALVGLRVEGTASSDVLGFTGWDIRQLNFLALTIGWPVGDADVDWGIGPLVLLMLIGPFLLGGARLNWRDPTAFAPLLVTVIFWGFAPAWQLLLRFALFLLPFYGLIFRAPEPAVHRVVYRFWLPLLCWIALGVHTHRLLVFAEESAGFEDVLAVAEPGERALGMIFDPTSAATDVLTAYLSYPMWYQAEKGGFVDFNFAGFMQEMVRYRRDRMPSRFGSAVWAWNPKMGFDWTRDQVWVYRYFFVRSLAPLPPGYFPTDRCKPVLVKSSGPWSLFENVNCRTAP